MKKLILLVSVLALVGLVSFASADSYFVRTGTSTVTVYNGAGWVKGLVIASTTTAMCRIYDSTTEVFRFTVTNTGSSSATTQPYISFDNQGMEWIYCTTSIIVKLSDAKGGVNVTDPNTDLAATIFYKKK